MTYAAYALLAFLLLFPAAVLGFIVTVNVLRFVDWVVTYFHSNLVAIVALPFWLMAMGLAAAFILVDMAFDATWGRLMFWEPKGYRMFTYRVQAHINACRPELLPVHADPGWRYVLALYWADFLNWVDPGHIDMPKEG